MKRITLALSAAVATVLLVSGCTTINLGGSHMDSPDTSMMSPDSGATMSDVMFAQMMIPHHEQAVEMSALAVPNGAGPEIVDLAERISAAQGPEIAQMEAMLDRWGVPQMMDHSGHQMAGMVSDEDMERLRAATGPAFDRLFLELMIAHHEGAIAMTEDPLENGTDPELQTLLRAIVDAQTAEIAEMQAMLDTLQ